MKDAKVISEMEFEFLVTNTPEEWESWEGNNCKVDAKGVTIERDPTYIYQKLVLSLEDKVSGGSDISSMALDECGILYFLEANQGHIYRFDPEQNTFERILCPIGIDRESESFEFKNPQGIWVTKNNIFIVDTANKRLHCISKHLFQTRWVIDGDIFSSPKDIVVDSYENIYVLDTGSRVIVKITQDGIKSQIIGKDHLNEPMDIAIDVLQRLYVLDKADDNEYWLLRFVPVDGSYVSKEPDKFLIKDIHPYCIATGVEDEIFMGESFADSEEKGKSLFKYLTGEEVMYPILSYKGSAYKLVSDKRKNLYIIPGDKKNVYFLKYSMKNKFSEAGHLYKAYLTRRFDSKRNDTQWHRIKLDFDLYGPGTQVRVYYCATNDAGFIEENDDNWSSFFPNPGDALFDADISSGRYLWMKIELIGSEFDSPRIKSLRIYYPRISYLRYLPAIYQEDESSRKMLENFLSLFESFFVDIEENIDGITRYFDPGGVPADYISWLGSWLGVDADETWTEGKKRKLITRAPELYRMRGTRQGMLEILGLYLGNISETANQWDEACRLAKKALDMLVNESYITEEDKAGEWEEFSKCKGERIKSSQDLLGIMEYFQLDVIKNQELKKIYKDLIGSPYCFIVLVNRSSISDEELRSIQRIVDLEKPAHTVGKVVDLQPWIYLGGHSYLGVNTILSEPSFILEKSGLGRNTVLTELEEYGHFDLKSRIGVDTIMS